GDFHRSTAGSSDGCSCPGKKLPSFRCRTPGSAAAAEDTSRRFTQMNADKTNRNVLSVFICVNLRLIWFSAFVDGQKAEVERQGQQRQRRAGGRAETAGDATVRLLGRLELADEQLVPLRPRVR